MTGLVTVDPGSPMPPYEQLRRQLELQIRSGVLAPGRRLPTVRQLASDLGLAKNTVARAFAELERGGFVMGAGRRGTIVVGPLDGASDRNTLITDAARRFFAEIAPVDPTLSEVLEALKRVVDDGQVPPAQQTSAVPAHG